MKPILSNYFFNDIFRKYLIQHQQGLHLCFLLRNLLLGFAFSSSVHFELIVINCLWRGSNWFFAYGYSTVMGPFTAKPVLSLLKGFRESLIENRLTLKFTPHVHIYPVPASHCCHYCDFVASFEIGKCKSSNRVLLFQDCFGCSGSLAISCEF